MASDRIPVPSRLRPIALGVNAPRPRLVFRAFIPRVEHAARVGMLASEVLSVLTVPVQAGSLRNARDATQALAQAGDRDSPAQIWPPPMPAATTNSRPGNRAGSAEEKDSGTAGE